jgi:two-component system, NtrC family, sensor histidine kinase HydH
VGLRFRLGLFLLVPMILVVAAYAYLRLQQERGQRRADFDLRVSVASAAIRLAVENALRSGSLSDVERLAKDLVVKQTEIVRIRLLDRSLTSRVDANLLPGDAGVPPERHRQVRDTGQPAIVEHEGGGTRLHTVLLPVRSTGQDDGILEISHVAGRLEADLLDEKYRIALQGAVLLGLLGLVAWFALQRLVFRPVADLMVGIERVGAGEPRAMVPVRSGDELGHVAAAFNRMTERLEEARQRAESETDRSLELMRRLRQTESLAIAGKLCSSIAHEVGTPLNIIAGRAELMQRALPKDSPLREDLDVIITQIDRISRMIRAALDPFRRREPERVAVPPGSVTEVLRPLLQHFAKSRGVTLGMSMPGDLPPVLVDPDHLQQVLINLLTNAIEATPAGGRVVVTGVPRADDGRPGVALEVRDTGSGIPEEALPRIFDPFFSTKPAREGAGLGLAICRDLVRSNGSDIQVASTPGQGTTFTVWIPEARRETTPEAREELS